jgi:hypothetical protein
LKKLFVDLPEHDSRRVNAGLWAGPGSWQAGARMGRPELHRKQLWFLLKLILVLLCGTWDAAGAIGFGGQQQQQQQQQQCCCFMLMRSTNRGSRSTFLWFLARCQHSEHQKR